MKIRLRRRARMMVLLLLAVGSVAGGGWWWLTWLDRPRSNYSQIEKGLWMGGRVEKPPEGTRAVLNLTMKDDPYRVEAYQWRPIADATPAPALDWVRDQVLFIHQQREAGRTVYVHCDAGASRSGLVVAAYLIWRNHWTRDETLEYMRTKRPVVRPNGAFMELLGEWERSLGGMGVTTLP
jgi:protein-tyrosine phosphatase